MSYNIRIGQVYMPEPGDEYYDSEKQEPFIRNLMIYGYRPTLNNQIPHKHNDTGSLSGWATEQIMSTLGIDQLPSVIEYKTEEGKRVFEILTRFSSTQYGQYWKDLGIWLEWFSKLAIDKYGESAGMYIG